MSRLFSQLSSRAQLSTLRGLALEALKRFPIRVKRLEFIHYGENATFKVFTSTGKFMLRLNRPDYHTPAAINEEIRWLKRLARTTPIRVPIPVKSKRSHFVEVVRCDDLKSYCVLFRWIEGRFVSKSLSLNHARMLGEIIALIQRNGRRVPMRHRRYWTSRGLLSPHAKFGNPYHIAGISQKQQNVISSAGKKSFKALASYERRFPERLGTIHADVHLGNVLRTGNGLGIIDFDDCGFGFAVYDIAVATVALTAVLGEKRKHEASAFKHALIAAYSQHAPWDSHDEEILPHLIVARRITMLAWFQSRSDNARLRKHFKSALTRALIFLRNETKGT